MKIFLPGGAGLVGLNLIATFQKYHPNWQIIVVDKDFKKVNFGKKLYPKVKFVCEDLTNLSENNECIKHIKDINSCVILQAEISNLNVSEFIKNNILSTQILIKELKKINCQRIIHISSSVINSISDDVYTKTKTKQEILVKENFPNSLILRPTLMFGPFDNKHLGWIADFMQKIPILPIPGNGRFIRQPLYVKDFCLIIKRCIEDNSLMGTFDITGLEKITFLSLMKKIRKIKNTNSLFIFIPKKIFILLLKTWAFITSKPVFTKTQLESLMAGDEFEEKNWPKVFSMQPTPLELALEETFCDSKINIK